MNERSTMLQELSCKCSYFVQFIVLSNLYELRTECSKCNYGMAQCTRSWATRQSTYFEHECIKEFYTQFKLFSVILKTITQRGCVRHHNVLHLLVKPRKGSRILTWLYVENSSFKTLHNLRLQILRFQKILYWIILGIKQLSETLQHLS
jgi:hypothetical protein